MDELKKAKLSDAGIDIKKGLNSFMGIEPMYEKFLNKFCSDSTFADLEIAIKEKNTELCHRYSHTLKGISGTLGMMRLYELLLTQDNFFKKEQWEEGYRIQPDIKEEYEKLIKAIEG